MSNETPGAFSRRRFLAATGAASIGAASVAGGSPASAGQSPGSARTQAFYGAHQSGIATPAQSNVVLASFDLLSSRRHEVKTLLAAWTRAAARLTQGKALLGDSEGAPPADTGEALGLGPAQLSITLGFGPKFFDERLGWTHLAPASFSALPSFPGDQLDEASSEGDLCIQACANDAQVAFSAVHNLARMAEAVLILRSLQSGFSRTSTTDAAQSSERNLLGFKDGTNNIMASDKSALSRYVWVGDEAGQSWLKGGSYLVARRMRLALEQWGRLSLPDQEAVIGRHRDSGAALGAHREHDPVALELVGRHGGPVIPPDAHIRVAAPSSNDSTRILRRGYSFADGIDPTTGQLDAGLLFICFQRDPVKQFVAIQRRLDAHDALQSYATTTRQAVFACPRGLEPGESWGTWLPA